MLCASLSGSSRMKRQNPALSTRSICLALAGLSLALHLLLAFFCLSVLQNVCVLPTSSSSSSSSIPRADTHPSASSHEAAPTPQDENRLRMSHREGKETKKELTGVGGVNQRTHSKLDALFRHLLYNLPPARVLQEDDWLLRLKRDGETRDTESKEEERESTFTDSQW